MHVHEQHLEAALEQHAPEFGGPARRIIQRLQRDLREEGDGARSADAVHDVLERVYDAPGHGNQGGVLVLRLDRLPPLGCQRAFLDYPLHKRVGPRLGLPVEWVDVLRAILQEPAAQMILFKSTSFLVLHQNISCSDPNHF